MSLADLVEQACRASERFDIGLQELPNTWAAVNAALRLLCIELPEFEHICLACDGTKREWMVGPEPIAGIRDANGWQWVPEQSRHERPCRDCRVDGVPTGRATRSWSHVLMRSMAPVFNADDRQAMLVCADKLQAQGDPLGEWIGLLLEGTRCTKCQGARHRGVMSYSCDGAERIRLEVAISDVPDLPLHIEKSARNGAPFLFTFACRSWVVEQTAIAYPKPDHFGPAERGAFPRTAIASLTASAYPYALRVWHERPALSLDCDHCDGAGSELTAREQAIAERIEPMTWVRDRMPQVGDEIEVRYKIYGASEGSMLLDVAEIETLVGRVGRLDMTPLGDRRVILDVSGGHTLRYFDMFEAWRHCARGGMQDGPTR